MKDVFAVIYLVVLGYGMSIFFNIYIGVDMKHPSFVGVACLIFYMALVEVFFFSIYYSIKIIKESINETK